MFLCVCNCKLNPDTVAVHFNNTELAIFKTRTVFLNFLVYAAGANNVIVCHRLALYTDCALMLHSFWFPSGSGTNGFLRHLLQKQFVLLAVLDTQEFYVLVFTLQIIFFWHLNITGGTSWLEIALSVLHELCILFGSKTIHRNKCLALAGKTKKYNLCQQKTWGQYSFNSKNTHAFLPLQRYLWITYFDLVNFLFL